MTPTILSHPAPNVFMADVRLIQNSQAQPQEIQLPNGDCYSGMMQNNVPHGNGIVTYRQPNERRCYDGEWIEGKVNGYGRIMYVDGSIYTGKLKDNKIHGKGTMMYSESDDKHRENYEGDWVDGKREGFGAMLWSEKNRTYVGYWKNDKMNGQGTLTWKDLKTIDSSLCAFHDAYEQTGTFQNDVFFEGESKRNGKLLCQFKNGKAQEYCIEKANGFGTIMHTDGSLYRGEIKDDKMHGKGTMKYSESDNKHRANYEGDWVDGKREGFGTMLWSEKNRTYVGYWKNDKMNGQGTLTWRDPKIIDSDLNVCHDACVQTGIFQDDEFLKGESKRNGKLACQPKNGKTKENCIIS